MSESKLIRFETASGSTYHVDNLRQKIRRLGDPTSTRRVSDEWKSFAKLSPVVVGKSVMIFWSDEPPTPETQETLPEGGSYIPFTATNIVTSVVEED